MYIKKFLIFAVTLLFAGCFPISKTPYMFGYYPKDVFMQSKTMQNIHFEENASELAIEIEKIYPNSVATIELTHGSKFTKEPNIYICGTEPCYDKYAIVPKTSGETVGTANNIMLNGYRLTKENTTFAILTHEMSHAYWYEHGVVCQPRWWEEGMAVYSSGGGGAEKCSVEDATKAAIVGKVFYPSDENSCMSLFFGSNITQKYNITWSMFYRQSGMFVEFLHNKNNQAFKNMLEILKTDKDIKIAIKTAYNEDVEKLWNEWLVSLK